MAESGMMNSTLSLLLVFLAQFPGARDTEFTSGG
jgi:hypothetical protein